MKKGLREWVLAQGADVYLFQEIKIDEDAIQDFKHTWDGYEFYYHPAEKRGYSGVATLTKRGPKEVRYGCGHAAYDAEGRCLLTDFGDLAVLNLYLPSGTSGDHRQEVKDRFLEFFRPYAASLLEQYPRLVISGDYNIAHMERDIHDPVRNKKSSGFLPHERQWMSDFLSDGWADSLRLVTDAPQLYTWWSYRAGAKARNKGWRIDYHIVSPALAPSVLDQRIYAEVDMSDHCPLELILDDA